MENFYGFLMEFTNGTTPCREHLLRRYSSKTIQEAIEKGYIQEYGKTSDGDIKYIITTLGKEMRDK